MTSTTAVPEPGPHAAEQTHAAAGRDVDVVAIAAERDIPKESWRSTPWKRSSTTASSRRHRT